MNTIICPSCEDYVKASRRQEMETYNVKGEPIEIEAEVVVCPKCEMKIFDEERDSRNLELAYDKYRRKHRLLSVSKISQIRQKYGLGQRALSRLLGWGEITLHRYEKGALPDAAHNNLLRFIEEPENMRILLEANSEVLSPREVMMLKQQIDRSAMDKRRISFRESLEQVVSPHCLDTTSGYREFDLYRFRNTILYTTQCLGQVLKTKMNKLMFYVDFVSFKERSTSMTGSRYVHLQYGPVPDGYELIVADMIREGELKLEEIVFDEKRGIVGQNVTALTDPDMTIFSEDEIRIMDYICEEFRDFGSTKISQLSHQETAYRNTGDGEIISYEHARELSIMLPE